MIQSCTCPISAVISSVLAAATIYFFWRFDLPFRAGYTNLAMLWNCHAAGVTMINPFGARVAFFEFGCGIQFRHIIGL
jgi:hypothetical protein